MALAKRMSNACHLSGAFFCIFSNHEIPLDSCITGLAGSVCPCLQSRSSSLAELDLEMPSIYLQFRRSLDVQHMSGSTLQHHISNSKDSKDSKPVDRPAEPTWPHEEPSSFPKRMTNCSSLHRWRRGRMFASTRQMYRCPLCSGRPVAMVSTLQSKLMSSGRKSAPCLRRLLPNSLPGATPQPQLHRAPIDSGWVGFVCCVFTTHNNQCS